MPALSSGDLTKLRGTMSRIRAQFNVWKLEVVATAKINQTAFAYPLAQITVNDTSSGWSLVRVGMLYEIKDGNTLITTGIVRKLPTAVTFYTLAMSEGSTGRRQSIAGSLSNNQDIIVYDYYPLMAMYSRIADGVFYKRWDMPYTDENSNPPPVCNMGAAQAVIIPNGATTASVSLSASNSFAWGTKTITGYQWEVPPAFSFTSGNSTSASIAGTLPAGFYRFKCTVTDSGGKSRMGVRPVWVNPYGFQSDFGAVSLSGSGRQDLKTREETFIIHETTSVSTNQDELYDGGAVFLSLTEEYDGGALSAGVFTRGYFGFIDNARRTGSWRGNALELTTRGTMGALEKVGAVPQVLVGVDSTPTNWTEVSAALADPSFFAWYLLEWHCPNALTLFDFYRLPDAVVRKKRNYSVSASTIAGQLEEVARLVMGNTGSASDGTLFFLRDPNLENNAFRSALATRITLLSQDIKKQIEQEDRFMPEYGQAILYGFAYSGSQVTPLGAIAHYAQGQGGNKQTGETILVTDQAELNQKVGDYLAALNAPPDMRIELMRQFDIFDPARHYNEWVALNIDAAYDPRGLGFTGKGLVTSVNRNWRVEAGSLLCDVSVGWRPETDGRDGIALPTERGAAPPPSVPVEPPERVAAPVIVWNDNGYVARCTNFYDDTPIWQNITGDIQGTVNDIAVKSLPRLLFGQQTARPLPAWAVSVSGTTLRIYYTSDIYAGTVEWTQQASYSMNDSTVTTSARIVSSLNNPDTIYAAWRTQTGTFVVFTTNGGTTWSTVTTVGQTSADTVNNNAPLGMCIEGNFVYVTARDNAGLYLPWKAQTNGGAFSVVSNAVRAVKPNALITAGGNGSVFVSVDRDPYSADVLLGRTVIDTGVDGDMLLISSTRTPAGAPLGASCQSYTNGSIAFVPLSSPSGTYDIILDELYRIDGLNDVSVFAKSLHMVASPSVFYWYQTLSVQYGYEILNASNTVIASGSQTQIWTVPGNSQVSYCTTYTLNPTLNLANAYRVRFYVRTPVGSPWNKPFPPGSAQVFLQLINPRVEVTYNYVPRGLYRVTNPSTSSASWNKQPPAPDYIPRNKYALSMDVHARTYSVLANDTNTFRLYRTNNGTQTNVTYTTVLASGANNYDGLVRGGNKVILFGNNTLDYSTDYGLTATSKIGNWSAQMGNFGRALGVIAWL